MSEPKSDLEAGLESLGKAFTGVTGRLFGPKAIGRTELPPEPAISREADAALEKAAVDMGRALHAAGEALKEHPTDLGQAWQATREHAKDPVEADEGWTPLTTGFMSFGGGLAKVAEGVLDVVAPRKPKAEGESGAPGEAESPTGEAEGRD